MSKFIEFKDVHINVDFVKYIKFLDGTYVAEEGYCNQRIIVSMVDATIEKIYLKTKQKKPASEEKERKAVQDFLTNYLEAMADLEDSEEIPLHESPGEEPRERSDFSEELDVVGKEIEPDKLSLELINLDEADTVVESDKEANALSQLPDTFFKKAYESMMLSNGDEEVMRKEMKRMMNQ